MRIRSHHDTLQECWEFAESFVDSRSDPDLEPLSQLLTGRYPPLTACLTWTRSSHVDVVVVDIKHHLTELPTIREIRDIEQLREVTALAVPEDVVLRLFLVEDMTAPVVEVLGSAFHCYPSFFKAHMHTIASRPEKWINESGRSVPDVPPNPRSATMSRKLHSWTEMQNLAFFSFPFRRRVRFGESRLGRPSMKNPTMTREYLPNYLLHEERITGIVQDTVPGKPRIGEFILRHLITASPFKNPGEIRR